MNHSVHMFNVEATMKLSISGIRNSKCYTSVEFLEAPRYCFSIIKTQTYIGVLFITLREIHS